MSLERIYRYGSSEQLVDDMATHLVNRFIQLQAEKPHVQIALSGGRLAESLYTNLASRITSRQVATSGLELWWTCESWVESTDPSRQSSAALTRLAPILPDSSRVHLMPFKTANADIGVSAGHYADDLGETIFDICLLGVGIDGHTAAIFPDDPSFTSPCEPGRTVTTSCQPGTSDEKITLTLEAINRSKEIWIMASGSKKREAITKAIAHDPSIPAGCIQARQITRWFVDNEAAADLPRYRCLL